METADKILDLMKKEGKPLSAGKIAEMLGIDKKEVDKGMKKLKADGKIMSPKVCYWQPS